MNECYVCCGCAGKGEGVDRGRGEEEWVVAKERYKADDLFQVRTPLLYF